MRNQIPSRAPDWFRPVSIRRGRLERGQSLVEMAVALLILVPLAAGVMLLGQYIHIKQETQAAARQAAWAATVDPALAGAGMPTRNAEQNVVRSRQFADSKTVIKSQAQVPAAFGDAMLTTFANQPLLKTSGLSLSVYKQEKAPSFLDGALGTIAKATKTLGNLPPNPKGFVTAEVHSRPEKIKGADGQGLAFLDPLDTTQLDFSARTVLLADAWSASGGGERANGSEASGTYYNRTVRHVVRPLVPTSWLGDNADDAISNVVDVLGKIPIINQIFTPGMDHFQLGQMRPDAVPTDKLVKYSDAH